ncbi:MAG: SLBB domain-containing protein [Mariprofundus sp.]
MIKSFADWVRRDITSGLRGVAVLSVAVCMLASGPQVADALQLTAAQLKMAAQLPAGDRARLAASAGLQGSMTQNSQDTGASDQRVPVVQPLSPQQVKDEPSALEVQFNDRLAGVEFSKLGQDAANRNMPDQYGQGENQRSQFSADGSLNVNDRRAYGDNNSKVRDRRGYGDNNSNVRDRRGYGNNNSNAGDRRGYGDNNSNVRDRSAYGDRSGTGSSGDLNTDMTDPNAAMYEQPLSGDFDSNIDDTDLRSILERKVTVEPRAIHQQLSQFGYELFAGQPTSFSPAADIPVPPEYVLGPGDELHLQYYGSRSDSLSLIVDREGVVELPEVGSLTVAGMSFMQGKAMLSQKIREALIGVTASISMGRLRSIRVFVLGDARNPGSYLVSGVSTMSNALFLSGGVSKQGSLRHILLKRNGKTLRDLDLYEFLLKGNSKNDARLLPGDVIFIPPLGHVVAIAGEVVRPAIYEVKHERSVAELVRLAGGAASVADLGHVQIDRIEGRGDRTRIDVDLHQKKSPRIHNGDLVSIYRVPGLSRHQVSLFGQVKRPGDYGLKDGMRLADLIRSREDLKRDAYLNYVLIQRTNDKDRSLSVLRPSLKRLLEHDGAANVMLHDEDKVFVLAKSAIEPIASVSIGGEVVSPGDFPLAGAMRVVDLLLSAGGATERAYLKGAEITRYQVVDGEKRESEHIQLDIGAAIAGDLSANLLLQPYDVVTIRQLSNWRTVENVSITGEVRFPGDYPIEDGEHLSSVLERAGGFTDGAYLAAAVFTRASIREEQQKQLLEMSHDVESEIARLQGDMAGTTDARVLAQRQASLEAAKKVLEKMNKAKATGRLILTVKNIKAMKGKAYDVSLHDGDALYVPSRPDELLIMGQVYNNTAMLYEKNLSVDDYIARAGGVTASADEDRIYVVHASGVIEPVSGGWHKTRLQPGDAIVVPEDLARFNLLSTALDWTKVFYQLGTALASMKVIGVL